MAMGPERSKPLHNFSLPCLKWGTQRFLRCVKVTSNEAEPSSLDPPSSRFQSKFDQPQENEIDPSHHANRKSNNIHRDAENNIGEVRDKLMVDHRVAAKKLKVSIFEEGGAEEEAAANARPWNLRTRRAACKAPPTRGHEEERKFDLVSSPTKVGEVVVAMEKMNERTKFSVSLLKEEVEEDFWALVGIRPPRRPRKRPRIVRRQLDTIFPGLWLTEVTAESYKVPDAPE